MPFFDMGDTHGSLVSCELDKEDDDDVADDDSDEKDEENWLDDEFISLIGDEFCLLRACEFPK